MAEHTEANPFQGEVDIVNQIADNQRAGAINAIHDMLFAKASDAMAEMCIRDSANTFFDEPTKTEIPTNETDNGTD